MHKDDENELTADERTLIAQLPREIAPGDLLEERVVRALRSDGYFGAAAPDRQTARARATMWKIAAALALFAGGVATGKFLLMPDAPLTASSAAAPAPSSVAELEQWL